MGYKTEGKEPIKMKLFKVKNIEEFKRMYFLCAQPEKVGV